MRFSKKLAVRSKFIALEAINFGLKPLYTSLISLLVIRSFNVQFWGSFVFYLVAVQLFITFLNWGQKPFLTKEFAAHPNKIGEYWGKALMARAPLLLVVLACILLVPKLQPYLIPLTLWVVFKWLTVMLDSLIQFNRDYVVAIKGELVAILVSTIFLLYWVEKVDLKLLIYVFSISNGLKLVTLIPILLKNRVVIPPPSKKIKSELLVAFPFFALTLAGMLQTKGDLYLATFLMEEIELGKYQVLVGFLLLGQALSGIILGPFLKNVFRVRDDDIFQLKRLYLKVGFSVSVLFTAALFLLLRYIYLIELKVEVALLILGYIFPLYFFMIESQLLVKHKQEKELLKLTLIAALVNFGLSFCLIPFWGMRGAMIGGILSKLVLGGLIVKESRKLQKSLS